MSEPIVVYLDLNHWYMLGEALTGSPRQPEHTRILQRLTQAVDDGQLMFPLSSVHYTELAENPRDHQREQAASVMTMLSRFSTIAPVSKILSEELAVALNREFGRPAFPRKVQKFGQGVGFAFGEKLALTLKGGTDKTRADLEAKLGMSIAEIEQRANLIAEYELLKQPPRALGATLPHYDPYAARRAADEHLKSLYVMIKSLRTKPDLASRSLEVICAREFVFEFIDDYTRAILDAGLSGTRRLFSKKEKYTEFLMSLPSRRVATMIKFHYLKDLQREWEINDLRDIQALSIAIPYCDVVVTDAKVWDACVNRAHLDKEFDNKIFKRLTDLDSHLTTLGF